MGRLTGKTALITGGASGIGLATARLFAEEGAKVVATGRDEARLADAAAAIDGLVPVAGDVGSQAGLDAVFDRVAEAVGRLDVVFVNAGVAKFAPAAETDEALFDAVFDVNVKGALFTATRAAPLMPEGGSIVFNTSVNNRMGMAGTTVYVASKAAVRSMVRTLAGELVGRGIRVNAVSPGPVETPIYGKLGIPQAQVQALAGDLRRKIPMGRFGRPEEIARAALFLASDESSFVLGQELIADGGWTAV